MKVKSKEHTASGGRGTNCNGSCCELGNIGGRNATRESEGEHYGR